MPPLAGEATLLTVYADVHYFFGPTTQKPLHHRFDKASYVYLYQKSPEGHGRIEFANNPGTSDQDSMAGTLENASIVYSYKKPTVFTLKAPPAQPGAPAWAIPAFDPRNERKYMYPIQSIDIYFWSPEDSLQCLESLRTIHGVGTFSIEDVPNIKSDQDDLVSPVVERLEKSAISVQAQKEKRKDSVATFDSIQSSHIGSSVYSATSTPISPSNNIQASGDATAAFAQPAAPAAYNPAAPAAPEARVHREKTPPPVDVHTGIGLNEATASQYTMLQQGIGHPSPYGYTTPSYSGVPQQAQAAISLPPPPPGQPPPSSTGFPPPPPQSTASPLQAASLPPPPSLQPASPPASIYHSATQTPLPFSPPPTQSYFNQPPAHQLQHHGSVSSQTSSLHSQQTQYAAPLQSPGFPPPPPAQSPPATQAYAHPSPPAVQAYASPSPPANAYAAQPYASPPPSLPQQQQSFAPPPSQPQPGQYAPPPQQQRQHQPQHMQPPPGGYSTYTYGQPQTGSVYDPQSVHAQVYRPTEAEAGSHAPKPANAAGTGMSSRVDRAEKSVGRFLKKLEKKL